jgi:hypothetical protein
MVADPTALPVTRPLDDTDAVPALDELHETAALTAAPLASWGVAANCSVCPTPIVPEVGLTETEATTGAVTLTVALPLFPLAVAVMVADPTPWAVTTPPDVIEATPEFDVDHATETPLTALPEASLRAAVNCSVRPATSDEELGETETVETTTAADVTRMVTVALTLPDDAVMTAAPTATAVTNPPLDTKATPEFDDDQFTVAVESTAPVES